MLQFRHVALLHGIACRGTVCESDASIEQIGEMLAAISGVEINAESMRCAIDSSRQPAC